MKYLRISQYSMKSIYIYNYISIALRKLQQEQFLTETPGRRCFMLRAASDHRGRKLGSVTDVEGSSALVRWPDAKGNLGPPVEVALDGNKGLLQVGKKP